ncbi:MAG: hypothetical protein DI551_00500 [Micavibrio aeruginosavorus]|uniref:Uncharacterized protein n=1 Tax=Micavibrio aeruginosavorus TaxID=349221 RepID=A0A2W5N6P8_9BACT|nr:MAG: hypothetical protein DI551_00500 [Micavibrio aeruginosavorus]
MQLLDSEQLEYAFQHSGISLATPARRFYMDLWETIQAAEKARDEQSLYTHVQSLRHFCHDYFILVRNWRHEEEELHEGEASCARSRDNAHEANAALSLFEKQFYRYALCYLELNRALIHTRVQISRLARDYNLNDPSLVLNVNHATGAMLSRAHKDRKAVMEKRQRLHRARALLQATDPLMEELGDLLPQHLDSEGDHQLTLFKGALRKERFERAQEIVAYWKEPYLYATGMTVLAAIKQNVEELRVQDGVILHSGELSLILAFLKGDESRINDFVEKYNVPYMIYQYRSLIHLGYLLGRIGSLEGLIIQHARLASLAVRPQENADYAKTQEQAILVPNRALLHSKFPTITAIFDDMETALRVLDRLFVQTREYEADTQP